MFQDFEYLCFAHARNNLTDAARDYIRTVRSSEPSRMVGTHAKSNVVSFLPSQKMQRTISTESRGPEKAFAILSEYDDRVIEYWDQPEPINIERSDKRGRRRKGSYTPDFLVLTNEGGELVEVKTMDAVRRLAERYPSDWMLSDDGSARFVPGEVAAKELGLGFKVWMYQSSLRYLVANLELLLRSRTVPDRSADIHLRIEKSLSQQFAWTLEELAAQLKISDLTGLIQSIDKGLLYSDLNTQLLSQPSGCIVASSITLVQQGIDLIDRERITSSGLAPLPQSTIPTEAAAVSALERLQRLKDGDSSRTARRWRALLREGQAAGLSDFQSLLPKSHRRGNAKRKINKLVKDALQLYLTEDHGELRGINTYRSYIRYRNFAEDIHPHFNPVHRKTFEQHLAKLPPELVAQQRGGKRSGNAAADASDTKLRHLRAQLPWQLVAIDHYLADIYLIFFSSDEQVLVERPWVTAMIDQATGSLLAFTVSFKSPCKQSVAKVFRECVRLHGRLPQEVILDRGSDFKSVYVTSLLAHYEVGISLRPASHPRFGSEVERFFGEFKDHWLSQRKGNLADYKEARSVDGKLAPRRQAILRPVDFIRELSRYRQWRENAMRGVHTESPGQKLTTLAEKYPFVSPLVNYDSEFLMMTAVDTQDYTVDQRRGISTNGRWYYTPELRQIRGRKKDVYVRLDPENPHVIYVLVEGVWEPCLSSEASAYQTLDGPSQLAAGLTQLELSPQRQKFKQEQSQELARTIHEMDLVAAQSRECPVAVSEINSQPEDSHLESWIDKLDVISLPPFEAENWEVQS